jgi:hypothetical protein
MTCPYQILRVESAWCIQPITVLVILLNVEDYWNSNTRLVLIVSFIENGNDASVIYTRVVWTRIQASPFCYLNTSLMPFICMLGHCLTALESGVYFQSRHVSKPKRWLAGKFIWSDSLLRLSRAPPDYFWDSLLSQLSIAFRGGGDVVDCTQVTAWLETDYWQAYLNGLVLLIV